MKKPLHFGLIGENVRYTKSPDIFQAVFDYLKVSGRFEVHSVPARQLESSLRQLVLDGLRGFSVTIPYKERALDCVDDLGPVAQTVRAVNSVCIEDGRLYGYNTDRHGFAEPLRAYRTLVRTKPALILGNGGAARAVIYALYQDFDVRRFVLATRSKENAMVLAELFAHTLPRASFSWVPLVEEATPATREAALAVNCTPLGGPNHEKAPALMPDPKARSLKVYYDLNYNRDNPTVAEFKRAGVRTIDGSGMLVAQALRSFDLWTGISVDFEPIYEAVFGRS